MILLPGQIQDRNNLGSLLVSLGLTSIGVEVGTHRGLYAFAILMQWPGKLFCIDPWIGGYDPLDPASNGDREADRRAAMEHLSTYQNQVTLVRKKSVSASNMFDSESLDFAYIDGCHQKESVLEDLSTWWPKIRPGGLLLGHDFICPLHEPWARFVQPAAFEFSERINRDIYLIPETVEPWSFYFVK